MDVFYPSEWHGEYRCPSDCDTNTSVSLYVTQTSSNTLTGNLYVQQQKIPVTGSYASFTKHLTLQVKQFCGIIN